jgi:hypothetical protein
VLRQHPRVKGCTGRGAVELEEILGQGASWEANEALYKWRSAWPRGGNRYIQYLGPEGTLGGPKLELEGVRGRGVCGLERSRCGLEDGTR